MKSLLITKRDLKSTFSSPIIYLMAAVFLLVSGWIFFNLLVNFISSTQINAEANQNLAFQEMVIKRFFSNLNFLFVFLAPLISMSSISEERKSGTFDLLLSSPISLWSILLGKYFAVIVQAFFFLILTLLFPISLAFAGVVDHTAFMLGYMSLIFNIIIYLAFGLCASALTSSTVLAGALSVVLILSNYLLAWAGQLSDSYFTEKIFQFISIAPHFDTLIKGIFSLSSVYFYAAATFLILLVTKKILESRQW